MDLDHINAWDFALDDAQIASQPPPRRRDSRLLHVDAEGRCIDRSFGALLDLLAPTDVLVFNDTSVLPARLDARRATGGRVELLVVGGPHAGDWTQDAGVLTAMVRSNRRVRIGEAITVHHADVDAAPWVLTRAEDTDDGLATFTFNGDLFALLHRWGRLPLPPYIEEQRKVRGEPVVQEQDKTRYQSILADVEGAVAAPTASLHFDEDFLAAAKEKGVGICKVTLHVGIGTFRPVRHDRLSEHPMHHEWCALSKHNAQRLADARTLGGRIIAVGTTVVRTLETFARPDGRWDHGEKSTDIFIRPGYAFCGVDALVTNFHLPKSTLLALVAAFAGYETTMAAYRHALAHDYRFFSYGDAMFLEAPASSNASASE